jgi:hypothetical protein
VRLLLIVTGALLVGCGHGSAPASRSHASLEAPPPQPIPEELRPAVERATRIGRAIFEQDEVSARAADFVIAKVPAEGRVGMRGWVTIEGPWWRVAFVAGEPGAERVPFEASFPRGEPPERSRPSLRAFDPPRPLDADEEPRWRARKTAARNATRTCGKPMNPVVLPASIDGGTGWLVYLLNSTSTAGESVLGGHLRFTISPSGESVLGSESLSQCSVTKPAPPSAKPEGLLLVTPLWDVPNEGHVFAAMSNRQPLLLGTWKTVRGRMWFVAPDGGITLGPDVAPPPGGAASR